MQTSVFWRRPELNFPAALDTILFDVDGVLIRTIDSFHATDIAAAEYVAGTIFGLDWGQREGKSLFTHDDVMAFKQAGGYNNDWDMCYLLAALGTARLREWKGTSFAERSSQKWAALSRAANVQGHGGVEWVRAVMPATAQLPYDTIGDIYHELYWGASEYKRWFGRPPRYLPDCPGFVHNEQMLFPPDFFTRLREKGIQHMGMITGRVGPEVDSALERIKAYCGERWWEVVIAADVCPKPDPRTIRLALEGIGSKVEGGIYIGDTGDDLDVVLNYRATKQADEPDIVAVMVVHKDEVALYQQRGADVIVGAVTDVLELYAYRTTPNISAKTF
ncbi:MAG TPA: HAD family hydrolase [Ktedonobacteraceae bacterium]|nr:HAD family hydrolase [Ktedonobacteraceae bacterium]